MVTVWAATIAGVVLVAIELGGWPYDQVDHPDLWGWWWFDGDSDDDSGDYDDWRMMVMVIMMVAVMMMEMMMWGWPCDRVLYWEAGHYKKTKCFRLVSNTKKFYDYHLIVYFQTFIMDNPHPVLGSAALILTFVQPLIAMIRCHYEIEAINFYIFSCGQAPSRVKE